MKKIKIFALAFLMLVASSNIYIANQNQINNNINLDDLEAHAANDKEDIAPGVALIINGIEITAAFVTIAVGAYQIYLWTSDYDSKPNAGLITGQLVSKAGVYNNKVGNFIHCLSGGNDCNPSTFGAAKFIPNANLSDNSTTSSNNSTTSSNNNSQQSFTGNVYKTDKMNYFVRKK